MEQIQEIICDEENKEISDVVMGCIGELDLASLVETAKECYPTMEGTSKEEMKEYYCSSTAEELENNDECAKVKLEEAGKAEETKDMMKQIETCVKDKLEESK
ncbi:unnamed protein product [Larinioides sclopetarius]|uniref:DUF19 domain-containing protein n=1 Tax=Larinioides sclopetarius TaxID=280406 RepID=A0AAV2BBC6_9ARAC